MPPQGRTQVAAAEVYTEHVSGNYRAGAGDEVAYESDVPTVSYTALGEIVAQYGWPINEAFYFADCESSWNPDAVSWAGARGIYQLMPVHAWRFILRGWDYWTDAFVPERNIAVAYELWAEQGWEPWDCAP